MSKPRIVITAPIGEPAISILDRVANLKIASVPDEETITTMLDGTIAIVCRGEGGASHRIFKNPRCLFSPHLVGGSELAMYRIYESMANDMVAVIEGRQPRFCVNPEVFCKR